MPLYFLLLDDALLEREIRPALAAAWRQRRFAPGRELGAAMQRLSDYLGSLEPARWTIADLAEWREAGAEEDRADELAFVREWLPPLQALYRRAAAERRALVCELL